MSCPTLRHFQGAWLQTIEGFQSIRHWAEEAKTFSLHKSLCLPAGLSTRLLQCLVMLEADWWYLTQVSPLWGNFHWLCSCVKATRKITQKLNSVTYHTLTGKLIPDMYFCTLKLFDLVSVGLKRKCENVIDQPSNMKLNILFTDMMKAH